MMIHATLAILLSYYAALDGLWATALTNDTLLELLVHKEKK